MQQVGSLEAAREEVGEMIAHHEGALYRLVSELGEEGLLRFLLTEYVQRFDHEAVGPKSVTVAW